MQKAFDKMNDIIERFVKSAPPYYFLSVLPQLTSRICDDHPQVWSLLKSIIVKTFLAFPNHVFWHMVALSKSSYPQRASRCREILDFVKSKVDQGSKLIDDYLNLADKLIKLSDEKLGVGEVDMTQAFPSLPKLISSRGFSSSCSHCRPTCQSCFQRGKVPQRPTMNTTLFPLSWFTYPASKTPFTSWDRWCNPKRWPFVVPMDAAIPFCVNPKMTCVGTADF